MSFKLLAFLKFHIRNDGRERNAFSPSFISQSLLFSLKDIVLTSSCLARFSLLSGGSILERSLLQVLEQVWGHMTREIQSPSYPECDEKG